MNATATFEMNSTTYTTDEKTLAAIRSVMPAAKKTGDFSAVQAIMFLGLKSGIIKAA